MTSRKKQKETRRAWPGRPRRNPWYGIGISIVSMALIIAVFFLMNRSQPQVTQITAASALDATFEPVRPTDTFKPDEDFFISVKISGYQAGQDIKARWRFHGDEIGLTSLQTLDTTGDITAGFVLSRPEPWPEGAYSVDILFEDSILSSAEFRVEGE